MAHAHYDVEKKQRFSVVHPVLPDEKPSEKNQVRLILNEKQTSDLVRKISQVSSGALRENLVELSITEEESESSRAQKSDHNVKSTKRRNSLLHALKNITDPKHRPDDENSNLLPRHIKESETSNEDHIVVAATGAATSPTNTIDASEAQDIDKSTSPESPVTLYSKRLVEKNGTSNVTPKATSSRRNRLVSDIFTTLSDMRWRYCLIMFVLAYLSTWTAFSLAYWMIAYLHDDTINADKEDWDPCITNVHSFISAFLFSIETQHTIGYGSRAMKETCPEAIATYMVQSCASVLINSLFCGLVFAKLMSPRYRSRSIRFSKQAVISFHNGVGHLIFRVIDFKKSNLVDCMVKAVLIRDRVTKEGEFIPFSNRNLSLHIEETHSNACFLVWPVNVIHRIDEFSPLFGLTPRELQEEYLEIIIILEGLVENSGKLLQVRTSYVSHEIIWGASFSPMLDFNTSTNQYEMDYSKFDEILLTLPLPTINRNKKNVRANSITSRRSVNKTGLADDEESIRTRFGSKDVSVERKKKIDEVKCSKRNVEKSGDCEERYFIAQEGKMQKIKNYFLRHRAEVL